MWEPFLFFIGFLLIGKLVFIQFVEGDAYQKRGAQRIIEEKKIASGRGNIYASDGALLATSITTYEIRWDAQVPHTSTFEKYKDSLAKSLAKILTGNPTHANLKNCNKQDKTKSNMFPLQKICLMPMCKKLDLFRYFV